MILTFVRHAQSKGNLDRKAYKEYGDQNVPLSELGEQQAIQLQKFLNHIDLKTTPIITSEYLRTHQTAQGALPGAVFSQDARLNEWSAPHHMHLSEEELQKTEDGRTFLFGRMRSDFTPLAGRGFPEMKKNLRSFVRELEKNQSIDHVVVFAHAGVIRLFLDVYVDKVDPIYYNRNYEKTTLKNASIHQLEFRKDWKLLQTLTLESRKRDIRTFQQRTK